MTNNRLFIGVILGVAIAALGWFGMSLSRPQIPETFRTQYLTFIKAVDNVPYFGATYPVGFYDAMKIADKELEALSSIRPSAIPESAIDDLKAWSRLNDARATLYLKHDTPRFVEPEDDTSEDRWRWDQLMKNVDALKVGACGNDWPTPAERGKKYIDVQASDLNLSIESTSHCAKGRKAIESRMR